MTALHLRGEVWMGSAPLLRALSLHFPARRWSCLLGPSGVGKSTIARLIAGLPGPYRMNGIVAAEDGLPLPGRVAMLVQQAQLLPWADLVHNVTIGARLRGARPDVERARALLAKVGLAGMETRRPDALSGGQRQRVALARVLIEDCPVVVLDEPFSALDTVTRLAMQDLAARLLRGRTVILITHDPLEAIRLSDVAWLLDPDGTEALALPPNATPRDFRAPETLEAQARLLARLHARTLSPDPKDLCDAPH